MKNRFTLFTALIAICLTLSSCNSNSHKNPYNLDIIAGTEGYVESIKENPDFKMVDLEEYIPGIVLDIRYATTNNFTGKQIYSQPKAYVRQEVADSLLKIQRVLNEDGLGLKIFDAYRPYAATLYFYEVWGDTTFVAAPWKGSIHNRGCAVDLTLINLKDSSELEMPTPFDDFSPKSALTWNDLDSSIIANRTLLLTTMKSNGFTEYEHEWWHYNIKGRDKYPLMDISFEELADLKK